MPDGGNKRFIKARSPHAAGRHHRINHRLFDALDHTLVNRVETFVSAIYRSCHRQTMVFAVPVAAMIAFVPAPSALSSTIRARQTCFCGALRSAVMA